MTTISIAISCGPGAREHDCAEVRAILEPIPKSPSREWSDEEPRTVRPPFERLRELAYRDSEVAEAVGAMVNESAIQTYSPYRRAGDPPSAADRLADLCGLPRHEIITVDKP